MYTFYEKTKENCTKTIQGQQNLIEEYRLAIDEFEAFFQDIVEKKKQNKQEATE